MRTSYYAVGHDPKTNELVTSKQFKRLWCADNARYDMVCHRVIQPRVVAAFTEDAAKAAYTASRE